MGKYSIFQIFCLIFYKVRGWFIFKNARLIRFPFRVRGKQYIKIGENVEINDEVHIGATQKIIIEDNVLIASKVYISDHNHGSYKGDEQDSPMSIPKERKIHSSPIRIEKNVWIGELCCILQGVTIGEGSIIGAMSVVTKDIPPYTIAVGSPAKLIKRYNFKTKKWDKI